VSSTAYEAYLGQLQRRSQQRWLLGIAAGIAAFVIAGVSFQYRQPAPVIVAHVTRASGDRARVDAAMALQAQPVRTRETVSVPPGSRLLLMLTNGIGLRVNESSRLVFESPARLRIEQGTVYLETPRGPDEPRSTRIRAVNLR
jgi:hypothetical protein